MSITRHSGLLNQASDYATQIQEALDELQQMQEAPRVVTNPEELEALERAMFEPCRVACRQSLLTAWGFSYGVTRALCDIRGPK